MNELELAIRLLRYAWDNARTNKFDAELFTDGCQVVFGEQGTPWTIEECIALHDTVDKERKKGTVN